MVSISICFTLLVYRMIDDLIRYASTPKEKVISYAWNNHFQRIHSSPNDQIRSNINSEGRVPVRMIANRIRGRMIRKILPHTVEQYSAIGGDQASTKNESEGSCSPVQRQHKQTNVTAVREWIIIVLPSRALFSLRIQTIDVRMYPSMYSPRGR